MHTYNTIYKNIYRLRAEASETARNVNGRGEGTFLYGASETLNEVATSVTSNHIVVRGKRVPLYMAMGM